MIKEPLSKEQTEELFRAEALLFGASEGVPQYRIVELFGEPAAIFIDRNMKHEGYLVGGRDFNSWGECSKDRPMINYFYKAGFYKIVSEHNYLLTLQAHKSSEGGAIVDRLWDARCKALDKQDRADARREKKERASK